MCERVRCPVLVIHGDLDNCQTRERASAVAELTGGTLVTWRAPATSRRRDIRCR